MARDRSIYLMIVPVVVFFAIFNYWPMTWLSISFFDYKILGGFSRSHFVGLENFRRFFFEMDAWRYIWNTLAINFLALAFVFPAPILLALLLNELRVPGFKKAVQTISYLPYFISTLVLVGLINNFLSPSIGILNQVLAAFGHEKIFFLGDPKYFRAILVISGIWQGCGWSAIVYLAAISGIDSQLYEAAQIDGAGRFRQALHVTIPSIATTIVIMLLLQLGNLLNSNFEKMFLLQNPYNLSISEVLATFVYKQAMRQGDYSLATAVGFFNSMVTLVLVAVSNRISRRISGASLW
jgi:ABC-type polysaccharide transport system, permease component